MPKQAFHVLVAADASAQARAAVSATVAFPWPRGTRTQGVMVSGVLGLDRWRGRTRAAVRPWLRHEAARVQRRLKRRWPDLRRGKWREMVAENPRLMRSLAGSDGPTP